MGMIHIRESSGQHVFKHLVFAEKDFVEIDSEMQLPEVEFVLDEKKTNLIGQWWLKALVRPTANDPPEAPRPRPSHGLSQC